MGLWNSLSFNRPYAMGNSNSFESANDVLRLDTSIVGENNLTGFGEGDSVVTSPTGDRRSRHEARQHLRDHLFGSADELHGPRTLYRVQGTVVDSAMTYSGQGIYSLPSPNLKYSSVNLETAIAIIQELRKTATTEELVALQQALLPARSDDQTCIPAPRPTAESTDPTMAGLIRRRSFFTPGLATREKHINVLAPPSPPKASSQPGGAGQQWNPDMFGPSLSQLDILDPEGYHAEVPTSRSETPINLDYARIGHRLGGLRVINGAASPSPSITSSILPGLRGTAFEGYTRTNSDRDLADVVKHSHALPVPLPGTHADQVIPTPITSLDIWTATPVLQVSTPEAQSPGGSPATSVGHLRHAISRGKTNESLTSHSSSLDRSSSPGTKYQSESLSNPFSPAISQVVSSRSSTDPLLTTQVNLVSPKNKNDFCKVDDIDTRSESLKPSDHMPYQHPQKTTVHRPNSPIESRPVSNRNTSESSSVYTEATVDLEPLKMNGRMEQDSGYGSQSSLSIGGVASGADRISQTPASAPLFPKIDKNVRNDPADEYVSASIARTMRGLEQMRTSFSTPRMSEEGHRGLTRSSTSIPRPMPEETCPSPDVLRYRSPSRSDPKPLPDQQGSNSPSTMLDESPSTPKKLQKKRPNSDWSLTKSQLVSDRSFNEIPQVPTDVAFKFNQRLMRHPSMEHLKCTFFSVSDVQSRENPSRPQSGANFELRFPSPTPTDEIASDDERGRKSRRSSCGPAESVLRLFRSKSRKNKSKNGNKSRSVTRDGEMKHVGFADFGNVVESLGSSPYDAAAATGPPRNAPSGPRGMTHPHQMSTIVRSKSMFGMDEKAASQFARQRSRDRQANSSGQKQPPRRSLQAPSNDKPAQVDSPKLRPRSYEQTSPTRTPPLPTMSRGNGVIRPKSFDVPRSRTDVRRSELPGYKPTTSSSNIDALPGVPRQVVTTNRTSNSVSPPNLSSTSNFSVDEAPQRSKHDAKHDIAGDYFTEAPYPTVDTPALEFRAKKLPGTYNAPIPAPPLHASPRSATTGVKQSAAAAPPTQPIGTETEAIDKNWARPADFWRQRRRSIGEGLLLPRPQMTALPHAGSAPDVRLSTAPPQKDERNPQFSTSRHNKIHSPIPASDTRPPNFAVPKPGLQHSPAPKPRPIDTRTYFSPSPSSSPLPSPGTPLAPLAQNRHQPINQPHPAHAHPPPQPSDRAHRPHSPTKPPSQSQSIQARAALFERAANLNRTTTTNTTPTFSPTTPKRTSASPRPHPHPHPPSKSPQSTNNTNTNTNTPLARTPDRTPHQQHHQHHQHHHQHHATTTTTTQAKEKEKEQDTTVSRSARGCEQQQRRAAYLAAAAAEREGDSAGAGAGVGRDMGVGLGGRVSGRVEVGKLLKVEGEVEVEAEAEAEAEEELEVNVKQVPLLHLRDVPALLRRDAS